MDLYQTSWIVPWAVKTTKFSCLAIVVYPAAWAWTWSSKAASSASTQAASKSRDSWVSWIHRCRSHVRSVWTSCIEITAQKIRLCRWVDANISCTWTAWMSLYWVRKMIFKRWVDGKMKKFYSFSSNLFSESVHRMSNLRNHLRWKARQSTTGNNELDHNPKVTSWPRGLQHNSNHLQVNFSEFFFGIYLKFLFPASLLVYKPHTTPTRDVRSLLLAFLAFAISQKIKRAGKFFAFSRLASIVDFCSQSAAQRQRDVRMLWSGKVWSIKRSSRCIPISRTCSESWSSWCSSAWQIRRKSRG